MSPRPPPRAEGGGVPPPPAREAARGDPLPIALVMGGGGARAAYQVGFLRGLARHFPDLEPPILVGVSAGAINAVHLAAHPGSFPEAVEDLARLWGSLTMDRVFRVDARSLAVNAFRWGLQLASGGHLGDPRIRALVDTEPLRRFLVGQLGEARAPIPGIQAKLDAGRLRAVAISTSSYTTGGSVTWIQGREVEGWSRPRREAVLTRLTPEHVMASAALPLFFPAVRIGEEWYGDGGIRLAAPLSPAVNLGAARILALSTRFEPTRREASVRLTHGYPPPAQVIGSLLNAVFLDHLDQDAWRIERINDLLERIPEEERGGLRVIRLLTMRPSLDLGRLSNEFEIRMPGSFRFLIRGLGTRETESPDLLSFLLFEPAYLRRLMEIGERDAEARIGEIGSVLAEAPERHPVPGVYEPDVEGEEEGEGEERSERHG
jgi:NTE family protein